MMWQPADAWGGGPPMPPVGVTRRLLARTAEAAEEAIHRLQLAQETPWVSVAADAMRGELYDAIGAVRTLVEELEEARRALDAVRAEALAQGAGRGNA